MSATDAGLSRQAIKHYQAGQFREAEHLFRRLMEQSPTNWQYPMLLGLCRHAQGDLERADGLLKRAVALGDGQPTTHYYYGRLLADRRQRDAAREQYAQAISLDPNHVEARTGMGMVSLNSGDFKRAVSEFRTALRADPNHMPAQAALARALVEQGEYEEAAPFAEKALRAAPENPAALDVMGQVLFAQGNLDLAERCFRNVVDKQPENPEGHAHLAELLKTRHLDHEALQYYIKAIEYDYGGAPLIIDASISLERIGDLPQARGLMQKAAARWPGDLAVAVRLAEVTLRDGAPERAREIVAGLDQDRPEVMVMHARIDTAQDRPEQARELLDRVVGADSDGSMREARMLLARVRSYLDPDDTDAAREPIAALLDRESPVPDAVVTWSAVCEHAGKFGEACRVLEKLLESEAVTDVDRRILHNRLANCYDQADEKALAWANWQKGAWRIAPHAPRMQEQQKSGILDRWLAFDWAGFETLSVDDGFPAPVVVAGWPGSGREILLAGLSNHPEVKVLDPEGENRRLEAVGVPAVPEVLAGTVRETLRLGRKRFMRGVRREALPAATLETGWWQASAIPPLARYFPGVTVLMPAADPADLALQWRIDGYADVEGMVAEYRKELELWQTLRDRLDLNLVEIGRDELLDDVPGTIDRVCRELGLEPAEQARGHAVRIRRMERFVPAGSGARYQPIAAATGPGDPSRRNGGE